ncbi:MAG TPA: hypothetical protein VFS20_21835 [Longimicrobium sp.]|nr:hypothetical protein [Longimicrobium sp.]
MELRQALGIGTGTCSHPDAPAGSRRGRIVRLKPEAAAPFYTDVAVLLTEHGYSRVNHYHVLLPILHSDLLELKEKGVLVRDKEWLRVFDDRAEALLPVQLIQSAWYGNDIAAETPYVIDDATLQAVENELCAEFGLTD